MIFYRTCWISHSVFQLVIFKYKVIFLHAAHLLRVQSCESLLMSGLYLWITIVKNLLAVTYFSFYRAARESLLVGHPCYTLFRSRLWILRTVY